MLFCCVIKRYTHANHPLRALRQHVSQYAHACHLSAYAWILPAMGFREHRSMHVLSLHVQPHTGGVAQMAAAPEVHHFVDERTSPHSLPEQPNSSLVASQTPANVEQFDPAIADPSQAMK